MFKGLLKKAIIIFQITFLQILLFPVYNFKTMPFRSSIIVPAAKVNPCFQGIQVQASGFAGNLHPPLSDSISCKKPAHPNTTFFSHQNNNDRSDGKTHNIK
jgi:hypothetical protein